MRILRLLILLSSCTAALLLLSQCDIAAPPVGKEFIFPLAVGNKWEYDYRYYFVYTERIERDGKEIWEIINKQAISGGTRYTVHITGAGTEEGITNRGAMYTRPYSYTTDTSIIVTARHYIVPLRIRYPLDTLQRFSDTARDTIANENGGFPSKTWWTYVNKVGIVGMGYMYSSRGGSSGSISLSLRSYSLKP